MKKHFSWVLFSIIILGVFAGQKVANAEGSISIPAGAVTLALLPNHEDSSVLITINMTKLQASSYTTLGVVCSKENGNTIFPAQQMSPDCGNVMNAPILSKVYQTVTSG